jgi:hypothetical protein
MIMIQGNEKGIYRSIYHARSKKKCIYSIIRGRRWNIYFKLNLRCPDSGSKNPGKAQNPGQEKAWNPLLVYQIVPSHIDALLCYFISGYYALGYNITLWTFLHGYLSRYLLTVWSKYILHIWYICLFSIIPWFFSFVCNVFSLVCNFF